MKKNDLITLTELGKLNKTELIKVKGYKQCHSYDRCFRRFRTS